jgi:hypothetical protein
MESRPVVEIVGVPMDLGGDRLGVDMGPSAIRYAGLVGKLSEIGYRVKDRGNIRVADPDEGLATHAYKKVDPERMLRGARAHYVEEIVRACEELATVVSDIVRAGDIPLVLGGDHSMTMGTLAGLARAGKRPGVIYVDAHPDINTPETSPSGNVHGMPLAVAFGLAADPATTARRGEPLGVIDVRVDGHSGRRKVRGAGGYDDAAPSPEKALLVGHAQVAAQIGFAKGDARDVWIGADDLERGLDTTGALDQTMERHRPRLKPRVHQAHILRALDLRYADSGEARRITNYREIRRSPRRADVVDAHDDRFCRRA